MLKVFCQISCEKEVFISEIEKEAVEDSTVPIVKTWMVSLVWNTDYCWKFLCIWRDTESNDRNCVWISRHFQWNKCND